MGQGDAPHHHRHDTKYNSQLLCFCDQRFSICGESITAIPEPSASTFDKRFGINAQPFDGLVVHPLLFLGCI